MIGCPWLAVEFAGSAGMPIIAAGLFFAGVWTFFEMGERAFLWYGSCYLVIGIVAMLISAFMNKRKL